MNKKLFKFVSGKRDDGLGIQQVDTIGRDPLPTTSDMVVPIAPGQYINVTKDFKWTKTSRNSEGRKNTPTIELEEFYVTEPAFWSNIRTIGQTISSSGIQTIESLEAVWAAATANTTNNFEGDSLPQSITTIIDAGKKALGTLGETIRNIDSPFVDKSNFNPDLPNNINLPSYLKAYEKTYGVRRTKFKYKIPYLDNNYKKINSEWGEGTAINKQLFGKGMDFISMIANVMSPGVGIDYTKSFNYDKDGPSHTIKFFLDNTKDSNYSGSPDVQVKDISLKSNYDLNVGLAANNIPNYETNFRFIFLLLYQNLPLRVNQVAIAPPVIYRAKLPGVFSYRYCFFDSININMVGVRKTKKIDIVGDGPSDVVIPEGYEIELNLQSLLPESQNLYFDAIANPVVSTVFGDI